MRVRLSLPPISVMRQNGDLKDSFRRELKQQRESAAAADKQRMDRAISEAVISWEPFERAHTVFVYCSTAEEIDTYPIISACFEAGKMVCVPFCEHKRGIMTARRIDSLADLTAGKFGIPGPSADAECIPCGRIDLCIVPCLAADPHGYRLGYGGGYYDRFLAQVSCPTLVLCTESRLLQAVPREEFDVPCDYICTERRILIRETY